MVRGLVIQRGYCGLAVIESRIKRELITQSPDDLDSGISSGSG